MLRPSAVEYAIAGTWFIVWVLGVVWASRTVPLTDPNLITNADVGVGLTLAIGSPLLLVACGWLLGRAGRWVFVGALTLYVWGLLMVGYVAAMLMMPVAPGVADDDTAAGAGVVLLAVPALLTVAVLVGLGAGAGALVRAWRLRRSVNPPAG